MSDFYPGVTPHALIPGDPGELRTLAQRLSTLAGGLGDAAGELRRIDAGAWRGSAANAFRSAVHQQPGRYDAATEGFSIAAASINAYATALENAQREAQGAIGGYERAQSATHAWASAKASATATASMKSSPDPGAAGRASAQAALHHARASLDLAASQIRARLSDAASGAPQRHTGFRSFIHDVGHIERVGRDWANALGHALDHALVNHPLVSDAVGAFGHSLVEMGDGIWEGTKGMVLGAEGIVHFVVHPNGWISGFHGAVLDVSIIRQHPKAFAKAMMNWNDWSKDPAKAMGEMLPGILLAVTTAGAGAAGAAAGPVSTAARVAAAGAKGVEVIENVETAQGVATVARAIEQDPNTDGGENMVEDQAIGPITTRAGEALVDPVAEVLVHPTILVAE